MRLARVGEHEENFFVYLDNVAEVAEDTENLQEIVRAREQRMTQKRMRINTAAFKSEFIDVIRRPDLL